MRKSKGKLFQIMNSCRKGAMLPSASRVRDFDLSLPEVCLSVRLGAAFEYVHTLAHTFNFYNAS